jgi:hypothetical protein
MVAIEHVADEIARHLGFDPVAVRRANFYASGRDLTPYDMRVEDFVADRLFDELEKSSDYAVRRAAIRKWNAASPVVKRGIAMTPVKFGISFTATFYNQASALLHVYYADGSVLLNHGGTEMGQAVHQGRAGRRARARDRRRSHTRLGLRHRQDPERVRHGRVERQRPERQGRAGGGARDQGASRDIRSGAVRRRAGVDPLRRQPGRDRCREAAVVPRAREDGVLRAGAALGERVLQDAQDPLRPEDPEGPAVLLLRVRCGGVGGRD